MITGGFGMTMDLERGTMRQWAMGRDGVKRWADTNEPVEKAGLPGEQYTPSNSDEGYAFLGRWCSNCQRDKAMREGCDFDECDDNDKCDIIAASFRGEAVEWRDTGTGLICTAFVPAGEKVPEKCPLTVDMFEVPNARSHWAAKSKAAKAYREECAWLTKASGLRVDWDGIVHAWITFYPPDRRHRDDDNLISAFKSGRDGIADALAVNDKRFRIHPWLSDEVVKGGSVKVRLSTGIEA